MQIGDLEINKPEWQLAASNKEHVCHLPFCPSPAKLKVTQMMRKPVQEAVSQLEIQHWQAAVDCTNRSPKRRGNSGGGDLTTLRDNRVVVDELVLSTRQLEQLREDGVDDHVLRLVLNFFADCITELVERCSALSKGFERPVAIQIYEELGNHFPVEIELVNRINNAISDQRRRDISRLRNSAALCIRKKGEIGLREDGPRSWVDRRWDSESREGMSRRGSGQIVVFRLDPTQGLGIEAWETTELETRFRLARELCLQKANHTMVAHGLVAIISHIGMNETLDWDHVASNNARVRQQLLSLFVEAASSSDQRVGNCEKDDLDELDTDSLI